MMRIATGIIAASMLLAGPANGQTMRPTLDYKTAAAIRDGCIAWASKHNLKVAVSVFDPQGTLIAFAHMDGAPVAVGAISQWKGKSAATMQETTQETGTWGGNAPGIASWGGGVPFFAADGTPLGGVGTSGAESSEDIECGEAGMAAASVMGKAK